MNLIIGLTLLALLGWWLAHAQVSLGDAVILTSSWLFGVGIAVRRLYIKHQKDLRKWMSIGDVLRLECDLSLNITYVGKTFVQTTGWEYHKLVGSPWESFAFKTDRALIQKVSDLSVGESVAMPLRWRHPNNDETLWFEWFFYRARDRFLISARDLSLQIKQDHLSQIWSRITSDLILVARKDSKDVCDSTITWANEAWIRQYDLDPKKSLEGRPLRKILSDEILQKVQELPDYEEIVFDMDVRCPYQKVFLIRWTYIASEKEVFMTGQDITKRKAHRAKLEQAISDLQSRNADLERFASLTAHQLKSPPRAILGLTEALREDYATLLEGEGLTMLDFIAKDAKSMAEIVEGLFRFSRVRTSEHIKVDAVDLNKLLSEITQTIFYNDDIIVEDLPIVWGDETLLREVFLNLINNALKFNTSPKKKVTISSLYGPEDRWEIQVSDNGIGIPKEHQDKLFKMFSRVHPSYEGTGVGLAVVAAIVSRHDGDIWVTSDPATSPGSVFHFTLRACWQEV